MAYTQLEVSRLKPLERRAVNMNLIRQNGRNGDPFDLMSVLQTDLNRIFNRSLTKKSGWLQGFTPEVEVAEDADNFKGALICRVSSWFFLAVAN
jgi:hypothetical protein